MPRIRHHRSSSGNSLDSDSSGTVVPSSYRAPSSARSHRSSSSRPSAATASSRRLSHASSASRVPLSSTSWSSAHSGSAPPSSSASRPPVSSTSRSSVLSGTSSSRHPSSSHSSRHRSSAGRSSYTASESLSSRHSKAQSSSSGTAINASSYASSSRANTSRVSTNATSRRRSGISDKTVGPWDSISRVGTPPPSSQSQSTRDRNRVAYVVTDEPDACLCFCPPSNDEECYGSLACARGQQDDKRDYVAELKCQYLEAPPDRLESILDKYVRELADLIQLELYITSMERYQKRTGREDVRGQLDQISAKYETTMSSQQLFEVMGDIALK